MARSKIPIAETPKLISSTRDRQVRRLARERDQATAGDCLSPDVLQMCARLGLERQERNQFPVGAFFDRIDSERHSGRKPSAEQLMVVAKIGRELLYGANLRRRRE